MVYGDTKAFSADSVEPALAQSDGIVLYSMRFCPFAERTRILLLAKEVPHEIININLRSKPDWYLKRNPLGKVPCLQEPGGKLTYESLIVAEYIDDKFNTGLKFLPSDLYERAQQKMLIEVLSEKFLNRFGAAQFKGGEDNIKAFVQGLEEVEANMLNNKFFTGPSVSFVDLMVWPWFSRIGNLKDLRSIDIPEEKYPKILAWTARMYKLPYVKNATQPMDLLLKFAIPYVAGKPNYDEGL